MNQDKTQIEENGMPFSRAATPYWFIWFAFCGRTGKRSFALLRHLARTGHYLRSTALRPNACRFAELANTALKEY